MQKEKKKITRSNKNNMKIKEIKKKLKKKGLNLFIYLSIFLSHDNFELTLLAF